ncbi:Flagellar basal-body rod protein FlgF [Rhodovulum sp. PH10]|uniref:flagellar basal-body rod protein FlgF n=1 Tax=Rhodovulum sp. PH10 TaxID=1187851 RepID=UPI00027C20B0|nr:flagellar basal-body rod protein FlgF [Rhodovulum sp. PH10]EJW09680.1 Flagellar basal-body rod protein FlgF [Rhodovulum sp. PH10]
MAENTALVGLSSQVALRRELDVVANNIANVNTSGFKADHMMFEEYLSPKARENRFGGRDRLVNFVEDRATWHDFRPGALQQTNNPLDVAIDGDAFLVVQTPNGERYTRAGNLKIDQRGTLVTTDGLPVMGDAGPITFQQTDHSIAISPDGRISVLEGTATVESQRGKLRLVQFADTQRLVKEGGTRFSAPQGVAPVPSTTAKVNQGFVEKSNVNNVVEMTRLIEINRAYTNVSSLLQQHNDLRKSAIERLAEVPT